MNAFKSEATFRPEALDPETDHRPADRDSLSDRWTSAMDDIAHDAQTRADAYPAQSLVPEGGE